MEQAIQVTGLCVVGAVLALTIRRGSPETALLLSICAAAGDAQRRAPGAVGTAL